MIASPWKDRLDIAVAVLMAGAAASVIWLVASTARASPSRPAPTPTAGSAASLPAKPIEIGQAPVMGDLSAQVALILYSDFECPYCKTFATQTLGDIVRQYVQSGRVLLVFKHFPLESIHPNARAAAEAAVCSSQQNKFWGAHDFLFGRSSLGPADVAEVPRVLGLDAKIFGACIAQASSSVVDSDIADARELGIRGTPTLLFGKITDHSVKIEAREVGAASLGTVQRILDGLLVSGSR